MSQVLISQYLNNLADLKKLGDHRESVVREAFKDLLKGWGKAHDLIFVPAWGEELMNLHIGYEKLAPAKVRRADKVDEKLKETGASPKVILKADKEAGRIVLDSETTLSEVPAEAWEYKLGNRCALEWILDQYKEKKPKDPTIREKFNTYRFADYKEKVIDLLLRVTAVSVRTVEITKAMGKAVRS